MDRRALLAIFLSTLLIIAYEIFFMPKAPPPGEEEIATELGGAPPPPAEEIGALDRDLPARAGPGETESPTDTAAAPAEIADSRIVSVVTPLYRMEIDTRGGVIRTIELLQYANYERDGPVRLTRPTDPPGLGLVVTVADRDLPMNDVVFLCDSPDVRIQREGEEAAIFLERTLPNGISVSRTFHFRGDSYRVDIDQRIAGASGAPEIYSYRMLWDSGIAPTELPAEEMGDVGKGMGAQQRDQISTAALVGNDVVKHKLGKIDEGVQLSSGVRWAAVRTKYFAIALVPVEETGAELRIYEDEEANRVRLDAKFPVRSSMGSDQRFALYAGPVDLNTLKAEGFELERMIQLGWSFIQPIARVLLLSMHWIYKFVPNYGWVIVIVSVATKLLMHPLTHKQMKSMKDMQRLQGRVTELREKHKNDSQRMNKEVMELYKREGVNPMGGCFPLLLQMPVFFALYQVLINTIQLRQAPWMLWIDDLSGQEVMFDLPFALPFLGASFSLLPILMGGSMFLQQKMTTVDPRQKAMVYIMPVMFTVLFYRLPSGLVLYWLVNNVLSIIQQKAIHGTDGAKPKEEKASNETKSIGNSRSTTRTRKGRSRKQPASAKETP